MTRDEIKAIYDAGPETVITLVLSLVEQVEQLTARVAELEARLAINSRNSNQPHALAKNIVCLIGGFAVSG